MGRLPKKAISAHAEKASEVRRNLTRCASSDTARRSTRASPSASHHAEKARPSADERCVEDLDMMLERAQLDAEKA